MSSKNQKSGAGVSRMGSLRSCDTRTLDCLIQNGETLACLNRSAKFEHDGSPAGVVVPPIPQSVDSVCGEKLRRHKGRVTHRNSKTQAGSFIIHFALFWAPILAVFGVILWVRAISIRYVQDQRSLDRCVHSVLERRCIALNTLSATNLEIIQLMRIVESAEASRKVVSLIPGVGVAANAAIEASIDAARTSAQMIARSQDAVVAIEEIASLGIRRCGLVFKGATPLQFSRPATPESTAAKIAPPLKWDLGMAASEFQIRSWNLKIQSFGHCLTSETKTLEGEHYEVSFRHAEVREAKLPWNQWSF